MKAIYAICLLLFATQLTGQNSAVDRYFSKYLEDERFTAVYVSPKMFSMVSKLDIEDLEPEVREAISNLSGLWVLTTEITPEKFYAEAQQKLDTKDYELLMRVRDEGENVHIWVKDENDIIRELLLLVGGSQEFVLLSFTGTIDLKTISKLANDMDIKGVKHLDKVEKKELSHE